MLYHPYPFNHIHAAKLLDNDLFERGLAQIAGQSISVVSGDLWVEYYQSTGGGIKTSA